MGTGARGEIIPVGRYNENFGLGSSDSKFVLCPKCLTRLPPKSTRCHTCKARLCPSCNSILDEYARICGNCGWVDYQFKPVTSLHTTAGFHATESRPQADSRSAQAVYECPICHFTGDPDTKRCPNCGYVGMFQPRQFIDPYKQPLPGAPPPFEEVTFQQPSAHQQPSASQHPPARQQQRSVRGEQQHKRCPRCGESISVDSRFCPYCQADTGSGRRAQEAPYMPGSVFINRQQAPGTGMPAYAPQSYTPQQMDYNADQAAYDPSVHNLMGPAADPSLSIPMYDDMRKAARGKVKGKQKIKPEKAERPVSAGGRRFPVGLAIALMLVATGLVALAIVAVSSLVGSGSGRTTTPANDTTPPVISNITFEGITTNSIIVMWDTNEVSTSQVMICDPAGTCRSTLVNKSLLKNHVVTVRDLTQGTTYKITVNSKDRAGNETISTDQVKEVTTLTQGSGGTLVISQVTTFSITETEANISWKTDQPATTQVAYGETTSYGQTTPLVSSLSTDHQIKLTGLEPGTTYHYQIKSKDAAGGETTYQDKDLTTLDSTPPVISNVNITSPTPTSFTVGWTTNERTTGKVEYGTSTAYTLSSYSNTLAKDHTVTITGITAGTAYYFNIVATDSSSFTSQKAEGPKTAAESTVTGIAVGGIAPDFTLNDIEGNIVKLSDYTGTGKKIFLNFWATWCGPCMGEMPEIQLLWEAHQSDLVILAVNNAESHDTIQTALTTNNWTFSKILRDPAPATVLQQYEASTIPRSFYIDSSGTIKAMKIGAFNNLTELESFLNTP